MKLLRRYAEHVGRATINLSGRSVGGEALI